MRAKRYWTKCLVNFVWENEMEDMIHFIGSEDFEMYLVLGLFLFLCWLSFATFRYYRQEKRKIKYLHHIAAEGGAYAKYELAKHYREGKIVKKNCQKAAFWYQKAAFCGDKQAEGYLKIFLENRRKYGKLDC